MPVFGQGIRFGPVDCVLERGRFVHNFPIKRQSTYTRTMRISGVFILVVLLSMAVVVFLQSRDVTAKREALTVIATELREEGVEGTRFDHERAFELISVLEGLADDPEAIPNHIEDLKTISSIAASWAAGAASPSPELHASVALRTAAGELRSYAVRPTSTGLDKARRKLVEARHALTTTVAGDGTTAPSGLVTEGVRDRLQNLENSQKERMLEIEEELGP